jgi:DNA-binding NarL/FixJ family response regulator
MKNVYLIEDDSIDVMVFKRALNKIEGQYTLRAFTNGEELINYFDIYTAYPDILFIDLNTPRMNGIEFLKQLIPHKEKYFFPVIVLSTSDEDDDINTAYKYLANGYITKSISFDLFVNNLSIVFSYWKTVILPNWSKND